MHTIVIPTYNERENIESFIQEVLRVIPLATIVVVDDNSPDGTGHIVSRLRERHPNLFLLLRERKEGLGKAYIHAFSEILSKHSTRKIVMIDSDFSHDPNYLPEMLRAAENYPVVVGSRYVSGSRIVGWELWRLFLSSCGNLYTRAITRLPVHDCTSGFNVIDAELLRKVNFSHVDSSGYAFQIELKHLLWKLGARFIEMPIIFQNRRGGESKISGHIIREGLIAPWKLLLRKA